MIRKRCRRRDARRRGFSLIEVMAALGVLAFGLLTLAIMQLYALRDGAKGRHFATAAMIARTQIEEIQRAPFSTIAATGWAGTPAWITNAGLTVGAVPVQMVSPDSGTYTEQTYNVAWQVTAVGGNTDVFNVDVEVTWTERDGVTTKPTRTGLPTVGLSTIVVNNDR
ncbi:MAG: prepilin-type N-terminal cleavage/methylation domain-containing protein [Proteobacteria bacterium]|nr:prepilin-type N-terminal cleavage/methylation domain-containing protein [Pseudomonadota bacterium]